MARLITAALILHNWLIDMGDDGFDVDDIRDWMHVGGDLANPERDIPEDGQLAKAKRVNKLDLLKLSLNHFH